MPEQGRAASGRRATGGSGLGAAPAAVATERSRSSRRQPAKRLERLERLEQLERLVGSRSRCCRHRRSGAVGAHGCGSGVARTSAACAASSRVSANGT
eukprot:COSAG02_NODE_2402_length_8943_cov_2.854138_5_plen_98_part_00